MPTMFSRVIQLTEAEQLGQFFADWQGHLDQVSRGRFEGRLQIVRGKAVRVATVGFNQRVAIRGRDSSGMIGIYPVIDCRSTNSWLGGELRPGEIVVVGADHEINHCSLKQTSDWGVHLRMEVLTEAARTLWDFDGLTLPRTSAVFPASPDATADLMRQLSQMRYMGLTAPALLESPEFDRLEQECLRALVAVLTGPEAPPDRLTFSGRSQLVGRAEEFLRARLGDPVGMIDLCGAMGANDRTLRLAFRERYDVGPMTYFRILRLNAVRAKLKTDQKITIADAAREFGFHHLGNFAADYRRQFGMRPSETARGS